MEIYKYTAHFGTLVACYDYNFFFLFNTAINVCLHVVNKTTNFINTPTL